MTIQLKKALNFTTGKDYLDIDLSIEPGTLLAISGPSGSGKTTMLRLMAGLEKAELGKLIINGITWLDTCLLYTSPSPRDRTRSRMPSSA